jgi:hypothetical protein
MKTDFPVAVGPLFGNAMPEFWKRPKSAVTDVRGMVEA